MLNLNKSPKMNSYRFSTKMLIVFGVKLNLRRTNTNLCIRTCNPYSIDSPINSFVELKFRLLY